jgi:hypothetical protein
MEEVRGMERGTRGNGDGMEGVRDMEWEWKG